MSQQSEYDISCRIFCAIFSSSFIDIVVPSCFVFLGKYVYWRVRNLLTETQRFNELCRTIPGIGPKMSTDNLRALEEDGIVARKIFAEISPRMECSQRAW